MKKLFLVFTACVLASLFCSCEVNPENCNHDFTEFKLCKKCGHYEGFNKYDSDGRRPRISWTLGENVYLEFQTSEKGYYKLILSSSKTGLPHDSWNECVENFKCFDKNGKEIKIYKPEDDSSYITLDELNANECYYLSFKYIKEPLFYSNSDPEIQAFIDIFNEDKSMIYFWSWLITE